MFRFGSAEYLYLLLLIPLFIGIFIFAVYARKRRLERFGNLTTILGLMPDVSIPRVRYKFIIYLAALTLVIFAVARPQFGSKLKEVNSEGIEIMLAVDVSNSMLAQDFEPNRLERTKYAINRLLDGLHQDRIGLIVFAGDAYVQLPITGDYVTARNFVNQISTDMVSRQGTAIGAAINLATNAYSSETSGSRVLIVISDGENHEDDALAAAEKAAEAGIKVYTIGIGTPEGAPIPLGANGDFIKDEQGNMVVTKLDEASLEKIAISTGGSYIRSTNQSIGLTEIIEKINETQKTKFKAAIFEEYNEQYQYLLGAALVLLLLELLMIPRKNAILARFNIFKNRHHKQI